MRLAVIVTSRGWLSFLAVKSCLFSAVVILQLARVLGYLGLLAPGGIGRVLRWSEALVHTGMWMWRARKAKVARRRL